MPRPHWARKKRKARMTAIPRRSVQRFIDRPRRDFNRYKNKSLHWLQRRVEALPIRPPIWKRLRREQRVGFIAGVECRKFCFWYDMGMGKTMLAIALSRYFKRLGKVKRVIVLVPNKINKDEWRFLLNKHSPGSTFTVLEGSSENKARQINESDSTFIFETYGGLVRLLCRETKVKVKGKRTKTALKPYKPWMNWFLSHVQGIVLDESIMVQRKTRHGSLTHRLCKHIAQKSYFAFALNGTPFGRDPLDMWGQFLVVDEGETLGETMGLFRAAFYKEKENNWGGLDYEFDEGKNDLLHEIIGHRSIRYEADESTLPRVNEIVKPVPLGKDADEYYEDAKKRIIAARGSYRETKNAFLRMRQISSGFVGYDDDETGERARFELTPNPKLEQLISDIQGLVHRDKVVVFHQYTFSGDMIERELKRLGIEYARLYGKTKSPEQQLAKFHERKSCRVFILQNDSGSFGLDRLKIARYGLFFEAPVGTVRYVQTRRRIQRQMSEHDRVFLMYYVSQGTVDQQILDAHKEGIDLFEAVVEGKRRL